MEIVSQQIRVKYICKTCKKTSILIKYWKGDIPPDHQLRCHDCGSEISVKDDMAPS